MGWQEMEPGVLQKAWVFDDFKSAWEFAVRVADVFETQGHHGDLTVGWGKVKVATTTHDAGGKITEKDQALTRALDKLES